METYSISIYRQEGPYSAIDEFEEALYYSDYHYNLEDLLASGAISQEDLQNALQQSIRVCQITGINSNAHFKPVYVCDAASGNIYLDLLMSRKGLSLIMMHLPINEQTARWHWQLAVG